MSLTLEQHIQALPLELQEQIYREVVHSHTVKHSLKEGIYFSWLARSLRQVSTTLIRSGVEAAAYRLVQLMKDQNRNVPAEWRKKARRKINHKDQILSYLLVSLHLDKETVDSFTIRIRERI